MSFYRQDDCENWEWSKVSKSSPSKPVKETDILGGVYTLEPNKLEKDKTMNNDLISREVINSEIEQRYCSKHCVLPSEEPYCPNSCPARFLKNIVKDCPTVDISGNEYFPYRTAYFNGVKDGQAIARSQGTWIDHSETDGYVECPFCESLTTCEGNKEELHYCWNCGAKMGGDAENDK